METRIDEIADRIFRLSTFVPDIGPTGFTFNQFLIAADEPAIIHTGPRRTFRSVSRRGLTRCCCREGLRTPSCRAPWAALVRP